MDINREVLPLKTKTSIMDPNTKNSFELVFPQSRCVRSLSNVGNVDEFPGFQGKVQMEYNTCPVGSYAGPYDQN